jgi:hypothetical protein
MMQWIKRFCWNFQFSDPNPDTFLRELKAAQLGSYSRMQRYRDFRAVFLGTSEGKRVLWQLIHWAHIYQSNMNEDPSIMAFREGERNMGLKVMRTMNTEPSGQQQLATVKEID